MLPDLVRLHFIQKFPQILAGSAAVCSVRRCGLCKPAYKTHAQRKHDMLLTNNDRSLEMTSVTLSD